MLKPSASLYEVVSCCAHMLVGRTALDLAKEISDRQYALPGYSLLRMARIRLDVMSMLFERQLFIWWRYRRYIMPDGSPQLGYNFLCVREDRVRFPRLETLPAEARVHYNLNLNHESRVLTLSTMGVGRAGLVKKTLNVANVYLMETADSAAFNEVRCEFRGCCSDQGTEKGMAEDTVNAIAELRGRYPAGSEMSFMYPKMMYVSGHLHVLYNALKTSITSVPLAVDFIEHLKVMQAFLNDKQLRRKFQAECLRGKPCYSKFNSCQVVHVDWEWEFLNKALDSMLPLFLDLVEHFDVSKMLSSDSGHKLSNQVVTALAVTLSSKLILDVAELLRSIGYLVDTYAGKLESCFCHEQIRVQKTSHKRKQSLLKVSTGKPSCIWQGRTAPWFVAVGRSQLYHAIETQSTVELQERLVLLGEADRVTIVLGQQQLRMKLLEELKSKFAFWDHVPWSMCGVFYGCCGGDVETSRRILQAAINEFDHAVQADNGSERRLHRVARRMLSKTTICRAELSEFLLRGRLEDYAVAFAIVQEYALVSLVERRVEADGYRRCVMPKNSGCGFLYVLCVTVSSLIMFICFADINNTFYIYIYMHRGHQSYAPIVFVVVFVIVSS